MPNDLLSFSDIEFLPSDKDDDLMPELPTGPITIKSDLFTIVFNPTEFEGRVVDPHRIFLTSDFFNTMSDKLCIHTARQVVEIRAKLFSAEDIVDGTAPRASDAFTGCKLKDEYRKKLTEADIHVLEDRWAEVLAYNTCLLQLKAQYGTVLPFAKTGIQYAYVSEANARRFGLKDGAVEDPTAAIHYRVLTSSRYKGLVNQVESQRANKKFIEAIGTEEIFKTFDI